VYRGLEPGGEKIAAGCGNGILFIAWNVEPCGKLMEIYIFEEAKMDENLLCRSKFLKESACSDQIILESSVQGI